jgi:hypothetical protein
MKAWKVIGAGVVGMAIAARIMKREGEPAASMHEHDWELGQVPSHGRRYRTPAQLVHHLQELIGLTPPLAQIYLLRAITPAFREQIMIVTAQSNDCCT